ncbi:molybdopterin-guanine dinucleotide biosynthesis protein A [Halogeometricum borinquense DSM 11551]|uniref:Probable molybdenum cofactor guanylyltransferase n=2 Tax=Halogeometricum borinquense TaxID=60847 RepID=E4NQR6_HALBP|nr:molybdenum cofactor guanylyltransferase [Halogeometricum borinquense]ADQ67863.1 molybdenum cofactor guanylyltransferase [Halogeometricum borinquense DSM 11551]ELY23455.1 molybdopterin-guanine dinucleotide biosynthesis protein A [Halogeometricum borinquense DSM 11551]RYJ14594.1 molybdenum cofactor guanylyltransferase [Halogeometricum borinquense]
MNGKTREGVILGGGYSTRFGDEDKALAELAGKPLVRHVAERLATVCDRLVVNCRDDQTTDFRAAVEGCGVPIGVATDPIPDRGPMAGIRTGLSAVESEYAAVVACDMPFVDPDFLSYLFTRADGYDAAVPQRDDEWYQTTQAVYRVESMVRACERALDRGDAKILAALEELDDWVTVTEAEIREHADPETFDNVNTKEELQAAARRLE